MILEELRRAVLKTALEMERLGLTRGTSGNVSARDPESGLVAITPSGLPYAALTPFDITVIDLHGKTIYGTRKPSSEAPMHCAVYSRDVPSTPAVPASLATRAASAVSAVVHTHSPFATAFAVMNRELPSITVPLALLGAVPVLPFSLPGSGELAQAVGASVAQGHSCCLLQNHGLVCTGPNLEKALEAAVYVEEGAQIATYVLSMGRELSPIPPEAVLKMREAAQGGRIL